MKPPIDNQIGDKATLASGKHKLKEIVLILLPMAVLLSIAGVSYIIFKPDNPTDPKESVSQIDEGSKEAQTINEIDYTKLPLGDDKYSSSPKLGYVYTCQTSFSGGGAFTQGPWINAEAGTWDLTKKVSVDGDVSWSEAYWNSTSSGSGRLIKSADLPYGHTTGIFPISSSDDAYNYDRNPNRIEKQAISFSLPTNPTKLSYPECVGGEVGIATTGVLIFSAFDAGGRDAVATEVQDSCQGHPQAGNYYHYHGYSSCFKDLSAEGEHSDLLGYAFDGFGIYGLKGEAGVELSTQDLDECHGHAHTVLWDEEMIDMYHYHMTHDFPYTVSCFRGEPSVTGLSVGEGGNRASGTLPEGSGQQGGTAGPQTGNPGLPPPR